MELNLKRDVIKELTENQGQLLLHDEVEEQPGVFSIIPQWETVNEDDILTPRDVFELMAKEGYKVCFVPSSDYRYWISNCIRSLAKIKG